MRVALFVGVCIVAVIPHNRGQAVPEVITGSSNQDAPHEATLGLWPVLSNVLAKVHKEEGDLRTNDTDNVLKQEIPNGGFGLWTMLQMFAKKNNDTDNVLKQEKPNGGSGLWPLLNFFAKDHKEEDGSRQKIPEVGENGQWWSWLGYKSPSKEDAKEEETFGNSSQLTELATTGEKSSGGRALGDNGRGAATALENGLVNRQRDQAPNGGRNSNNVLNTVNAVIDQVEISLSEVRRFVDIPFPELKEKIKKVYLALADLLMFILSNLPFM